MNKKNNMIQLFSNKIFYIIPHIRMTTDDCRFTTNYDAVASYVTRI